MSPLRALTRKREAPESAASFGFAGWMVSFIAWCLYIAWAYLPESVLHRLGVTYYPSKYWAVALPVWFGVAFVTAGVLYMAVNLWATAPLDSFETITDTHARALPKGYDRPGQCPNSEAVPPIGDLNICLVNRLLFREQAGGNAR